MINPKTWKADDAPGWHWLVRDHPKVAALLDEKRWSFLGPRQLDKKRGLFRAKPVDPGQGARPDSLEAVQGLHARGELTELKDKAAGVLIARAVVSPDHAMWIIANPDGPGVAVNGEPVVACALYENDLVKAGGYFMLVDRDERGWMLRPLKALDGIEIQAHRATRSIVGDGSLTLGPIDLTIPAGQFVGVTGPSGVGKTSLLHMLARITQPEAGTVGWVDPRGNEANGDMPLAFADQHDTIYTDLPALDALEFAGRLRDLEHDQAHQNARRALRQLKLDEALEGDGPRKLVSHMSGGERHRVSVAGELLVDHPLVMLDEPTAGLDAGMAETLVRQLKAHTRRGQTVVMINHDLHLYRHCDRVLVLGQDQQNGHKRVRIKVDRTPQQLCAETGEPNVGAAIYTLQQAPDKASSGNIEPDSDLADETEPLPRHGDIRQPVNWLPSGHTWLVVARLWRRAKISWPERTLNHHDRAPKRLWRAVRDSGGLDWLIFALLPALIVGVIYAADLWQPMMLYLLILTTIWLSMSGGVQTFVQHRDVWEREKRLGLSPVDQGLGHFCYYGLLGVAQALIMVTTALVIGRLQPISEAALVERGADQVVAGWMLTVIGVGLTALAGTAFGLAVSAWARRQSQAQYWLAYILLAQILLTVQVAKDANFGHAFDGEGLAWLINGASALTASAWGHDLLKVAGGTFANDSIFDWGVYVTGSLGLLGLTLVALLLAVLGLYRNTKHTNKIGRRFRPSLGRHPRGLFGTGHGKAMRI
jgi:ABC-type multidrug transport system ATPase subunit